MGAWATASLFMVGLLWVRTEARPQLFQDYQQRGFLGGAAPHSALGPQKHSRLDSETADPLDDAFSVYSKFEGSFQRSPDGYQRDQPEANDRYGVGDAGYGNFMQPRQYHHEEQEKHGEVHYHKHEHIHQHQHKQTHQHKHKQDHQHKHMHQQKHEHSHHSDHKHGHKHEHSHHQDHKHDHHHGHDHKHDHHNDHKHDHHHGHKHGHKHEHKHGHNHGHKHDHKHGHKHGHHHSKH